MHPAARALTDLGLTPLEAEIYGHLLQTCALCHEALGMRMR